MENIEKKPSRVHKGIELFSEPPVQTEESSTTIEAPIEKPVAETPVVDTPPVETEAPKAETTVTEPHIEPTIPEGYLSPEDFQTKQQEWENKYKELEGRNPFANDFVKELNSRAANGEDITDPNFWKWQSADFSKYNTEELSSASELIKMNLKEKFPMLNSSQINRKFEKTYRDLFSGEYEKTDKEYMEALQDLSIDAEMARTELKNIKQSKSLPTKSLEQIEQERQQAVDQKNQYLQDVSQTVNAYDGTKVKLGDAEVNFAPTSESKQFAQHSLADSVYDGTYFIQNYVKDGKFDSMRAMRDLSRTVDYDKHIKAAYDQGLSAGRKEVAKTINGDLTQHENKTTPTTQTFSSRKEMGVASFLKRKK